MAADMLPHREPKAALPAALFLSPPALAFAPGLAPGNFLLLSSPTEQEVAFLLPAAMHMGFDQPCLVLTCSAARCHVQPAAERAALCPAAVATRYLDDR